jgi:ubiquinol-cytochrome c reductase cytochrome c1 subunit
MRALGLALAASALLGWGALGAARAQEAEPPPAQQWSFSGPFGAFDLAAAQRGFQIYSEVCSNCHSMRLMFFRNLSGIGLTPEQIKAVAAAVQVPSGLNDQGEPVQGPGLPSSHFRSPFPNDVAARAANNGALPPDLSLIVNAREDGANYVYAILTGYTDPPEGFNLQPGMNYNVYFPGHQIAMPKPLSEGQVTYADGTANTLEQEAHDVVTFLTWAANPEMVQRKQIGVRAVLFLALMTGLTYAVKRKVWSEVH